VDLDTNVVEGVGCASHQLGRHFSSAVKPKHLFDLDPVHGHFLYGQAKGFAGGRQCHLDETGRGHDRLSVHLVICQPRDDFSADLCLPNMISTGRYFNVHPQQRMSPRHLPAGG